MLKTQHKMMVKAKIVIQLSAPKLFEMQRPNKSSLFLFLVYRAGTFLRAESHFVHTHTTEI